MTASGAARSMFDLASFARHRPWCPEFDGPGDCTCGLYALLDGIRCVCGHKVSIHTDRDVSDAVGWPCNECKSDRCPGFALPAARAVDEALSVERVAEALHQPCEDEWHRKWETDPRGSLQLTMHDRDAHTPAAAALVAHLRGPR